MNIVEVRLLSWVEDETTWILFGYGSSTHESVAIFPVNWVTDVDTVQRRWFQPWNTNRTWCQRSRIHHPRSRRCCELQHIFKMKYQLPFLPRFYQYFWISLNEYLQLLWNRRLGVRRAWNTYLSCNSLWFECESDTLCKALDLSEPQPDRN